jgi:integrase
MMSKLLDLAMLWEFLPLERNPMELVKVKGSTKRQKNIVVISPAQFRQIVKALPEPYNLMVLVCGCMGLRVSEMLALKWDDFNLEAQTVTIRRAFTHGQIQEDTKTESSGAELPVYEGLVTVLMEWRGKQEHEFNFVFANPKTGRPYSDSTILTRYLKPAAKKIGVEGLGWHSFRHSYKSWMAAAQVNPATMKDLMRHSDIATTMDVYGKTLTPELRAGNSLIASQLF